ncbi:Metacaspase-1 protein [Rutstroemia sp. NJR-2017a BBW]|nr:Metacaspase-1 protein [Rutstroemia sp. NJR-2017a BBW]
MSGQQKRTYLVYSRGLLPQDLKLGSLYLDPANPLDGEYKRFESVLGEDDLKDWTGVPEIDKPIELKITASRLWLINSGLFSLVRGEIGRESSYEVKISGTSGRRFQIKRPESFLNEVILKFPPARAWLANQLSISRYVYYLNRATLGLNKLPRIWLVTGIQYITNAEVVATRAQSKKISASVNIPIPEPIAAVATILGGQEGIAGGIENSRTNGTTTFYHHADERVWAAQFTQLSVKFSPGPISADELPTRLPLHDLVDIKSGGIRNEDRPVGPSLSEEFAETSVLDDEGCVIQPYGEDLLNLMQDVDWTLVDKFSKAVHVTTITT